MSIAEIGIHSRNPLIRKGTRSLLTIPRKYRLLVAGDRAFRNAPPTLANSFPKSGTHLLDQILGALPRRRNYGAFLTSMTESYHFRERTKKSTQKHIRTIVPGELVRAHLFYDRDYETELAERGFVHFFVYRDLRDVVVSEAHYLKEMNVWHQLHSCFRACETVEKAIALAIRGLPAGGSFYYPNIAERFSRYRQWLASSSVYPIRFEDLVSPGSEERIRDMVLWYADRTVGDIDVEEVTGQAIRRIEPQRSHTFRKGETGGWRQEFTQCLCDEFKAVAGQLLIDLGYETSDNW